MLDAERRSGAIAGVTVTAASGIEIALWDLRRRAAQTRLRSTCSGGRFRDRVRFYRTLQVVKNVEDMSQWKDQVRRRAPKSWAGPRSSSRATACRPPPIREYKEPGHDPYTRSLTAKDIAASSRAWRRCARAARPRHRLRRRSALAVRRPRRHSAGEGARAGEADVAGGSGAAGQSRSDGPRHPCRGRAHLTGENLYTPRRLPQADRTAGAATGSTSTFPSPAGCSNRSASTTSPTTITSATAAHNPASPVGTHRVVPRRRVHARRSASTSSRSTSTGGRTSSSMTAPSSITATTASARSPASASPSTRM